MSVAIPASAFHVPRPFALSRRGRSWAATLLFLAVAILFLFVDQRIAPVGLRDEARNANNAIDMMLRGFSLVVTYDFQPDLWNTKPPLAFWLMSGSMALFGPSEWALRLPSAVAAVGTLLLVIWFVRKVGGSTMLALASAALLLLSPGFFGEHGARTADFDATLLFFITGGLMLLFLGLGRSERSRRRLLGSGAMIGLGALTKSVAAFVPVVGILLFILLAGRVRRTLAAWPRVALAAAAALLPLVAFYAAREAAGPGYVAAVFFNDIAGRFTEALIVRSGPTFYVEHLLKGWFFAGPLLLALPLVARDLRGRRRWLALYAGCIVAVALAIYTSAVNRAMQYALPLFPWLAILAALTLEQLVRRFVLVPWREGRKAPAFLFAAVLTLILGQLTARAAWWRYEGFPARTVYAQSSYGDLFAALAARGVSDLVVVDPGTILNDEPGYAPMLRWNQLVWAQRGFATTHLRTDPGAIPRAVASCEPDIIKGWSGAEVERIGLCAVRWPAGQASTAP